ncbi:MAG: NUDIX hydrolase [bacterium]
MDNITLQVGVKVLVKNGANQYLFLYKSPHASKGFQDKWDIPGGRIIPGTDLLTNLKREIVEEVGDLAISEINSFQLKT